MALKHDTTHPKPSLWGAEHATGSEVEGDTLVWRSGEYVAEAPSTSGELMISSTPATDPITPDDILLNSAGDDFLYQS